MGLKITVCDSERFSVRSRGFYGSDVNRPERVSAVRARDVMVNPVALTCLPLCTVVSENNYIVRRTALFGRRKAVLQTMVYRYEFFCINPGKTPGNKRNIPDVTYFHFCQQHPPRRRIKAACSIGKPYIKGNYVLRFVLNRDALLLRITNQIIHVL